MLEKTCQILNELSKDNLSAGLYIVATDIGDRHDITLRALSVLSKVDYVICEEFKSGSRLLKYYGIKKPLEPLNEHNEKDQTPNLIKKLMTNNIAMALISDAGTPLFADPGRMLVQKCHYYNIPVIPVPGASSLMAALMVGSMETKSAQFTYFGFLPANKQERIQSLYKIKADKHINYIFLETPYRLQQFLRDMYKVLGSSRRAAIAYKLTTPQEKVFNGTLHELIKMTEDLPKGEFVFLLKAYSPFK